MNTEETFPAKARQLFTPMPFMSWMLYWERGSAWVARSQAALVSAYIDTINNIMAVMLRVQVAGVTESSI